MNYSGEGICDDEDRQGKELGPEVSHPRSVAYGCFYRVRSYVLADWTPTCQVLRNGLIAMWPDLNAAEIPVDDKMTSQDLAQGWIGNFSEAALEPLR
jgi:hypothetical protein